MEGWISINRRIEKHWIWRNPLYFRAWIYCIMRANHTDTKIEINGQLIHLKRGEFITSRYNFSADTGMTERQTRTFWKLLEKDQMVVKNVKKATKQWTKLIVCNYEHYQDRRPSKRPTDDQQTTIDNNVNNVNNKNIDLFDLFWTTYDHKVKRQLSLKIWKKLSPDEREAAISTLTNFKTYYPDKQYRPHPSTYLNQRMWEDEIYKAPKNGQPTMKAKLSEI